YQQNGGRHGITMQVVQRGQSFVGSMRDADTVLASRARMQQEPAGGGKGRTAEVDVLSTLPEHSTIEGEVEGRLVEFVKSYQGKSSTSVWGPGGKSMTVESPGHRVHYRGTLDATGSVLRGVWRIRPREADDEPLRDQFELRRRGTGTASF
ncbi:MAG: hypothetical protein WBO45_13855, partial [Planctomycetota bacterium]